MHNSKLHVYIILSIKQLIEFIFGIHLNKDNIWNIENYVPHYVRFRMIFETYG